MRLPAFALAFIVVALLLYGAATAAKTARLSATTLPSMTPLVGDVLSPPRVVLMSDGRDHLVYEVRLANVMDGRVDLKRLAVLDGA